MSIIQRMKEIKEGMTEAELAAKLGEKPSRVGSILHGKQKVPEDFLVKFIEVFKVDANWLLFGMGEPPKTELTRREAILVDHFRNSPKAGQDAMLTTGAAVAQYNKGKVKKAG